jgi:endonuclease/exonuclease/phosphatase family metal-dependent hydrolase
VRILTYNICRGGVGREPQIAAVIRQTGADLVVLQEAISQKAVARIAEAAELTHFRSSAGRSLAFISRAPVAHYEWHKPRRSRHAFLEIAPVDDRFHLFGVHLSAVHSAWTEQRRVFELRALLASVARHQQGFHLLVGDFNTLAPGEVLDLKLLPRRLRALVWLSGGRIRWRTIKRILDAGYVDGFRVRNPDVAGFTFPTWNPHLRLDYAFVPAGFADRLQRCDVVTIPEAIRASDHFPILVEI